LFDKLSIVHYNVPMTSRKLKNITPTGVLAERKKPDGVRRKIKLTQDERQALKRSRLAEAAAAMFLNIEEPMTWAQIATELGMSLGALRDLTKSEEFNEKYSALFPELGHDPRYRAAIGAIGNMLPKAVNRLDELLSGSRVPAAVTMKAIEKILAINGVENLKPAQSDRADLVKFLETKGVTIQTLNVNVPPEYAEAMRTYQVIEGECTDLPSSTPDNVDGAGCREALTPPG
jgi:hypothetical protein